MRTDRVWEVAKVWDGSQGLGRGGIKWVRE